MASNALQKLRLNSFSVPKLCCSTAAHGTQELFMLVTGSSPMWRSLDCMTGASYGYAALNPVLKVLCSLASTLMSSR